MLILTICTSYVEILNYDCHGPRLGMSAAMVFWWIQSPFNVIPDCLYCVRFADRSRSLAYCHSSEELRVTGTAMTRPLHRTAATKRRNAVKSCIMSLQERLRIYVGMCENCCV